MKKHTSALRFMLTALSLLLFTSSQAQGSKDSTAISGKKDTTILLGAVTVTSQKQFIEQSAGKLVLNVAASPVAAGGNAYEVLLKAPGMLEQDQTLRFRNKSVNVMINGRPSNLSGEELNAMLSAMPAASIEKIEILTNPSAAYDAQGGTVVNIKLAKNKNFGANGTLTAGTGTGKYWRYNGGLSLNYRNKNLYAYSSYDLAAIKQYSNTRSLRLLDATTNIAENDFARYDRQNHLYKAGLDLDFNKSNTIGILAKGMVNIRKNNSTNNSLLDQVFTGNDSSSAVTTNGKTRINSPSLNIYYKFIPGKGKELTINADYFSYHKTWNDDFSTHYLDNRQQAYRADYLLQDHSVSRIIVKTVAADYLQSAGNNKWQAGLKTTFNNTDNNTGWKFLDGADWKTDAGKTNHFIYSENISAGYLNYSGQIEKISFEAGLRAEYTRTDGFSKTLQQTHHNDYFNLFPSASVNYNASEAHQFGLSYRRRIERFGFDVINPFTTYISQYRYSQGNPFIRPCFYNNFELSHTYKNKLFSSIGYSHFTDVLTPVFKKDPDSDAVISTMENLNNADQAEATVTCSTTLLKGKWSMTHTVGGMYAVLHDRTGLGAGSATAGAYFSASNILRFNKGWSAELSGNLMSSLTIGVLHIRPQGAASVGVSKTVFKNNGKLSFNISDLFRTQLQHYTISSFGTNSNTSVRTDSRLAKLVFTWKFGNKNVKAAKIRTTGIDEQKNRMGNNQ